MNVSHTPGPWLAMQGMIVAEDPYGPFICRTDLFDEVQDPKRRLAKSRELANARLIAAAPDLLAIAESYKKQLETMGMNDGPEYREICEVVFKAVGR